MALAIGLHADAGGDYNSYAYSHMAGTVTYFGNELYALSLSDSTMSRLNDPGLPLAGECSSSTANGTQPGSRLIASMRQSAYHASNSSSMALEPPL